MSVVIGCDIGQAVDPTAIIVLESGRPEPTHAKDIPELRHIVRHIEKIQLGTSYLQVVERIATIGEYSQSLGHPVIVLDATGVGRPIVDMLRKRTPISLRAVTFTGGDSESHTDAYAFRVPKRDLVTSLEVVLQSRRLDVVPDCPLQQDLRAELGAFQFNVSARGHDTYDAVSGSHDDLVSALMLSLWWAERGDQAEGFSTAWRMMASR